MKLIDLVKHLREYILYDTGGHRIDWPAISEGDDDVVLLRWSNEELTAFINEATRQVYRRVLPFHGYWTDFDIPVVIGVSEYTYDPRILRILAARLETVNRNLCDVDTEQFDYFDDGTWRDKTGTPENYILDYTTGLIRLQPTPEAVDVLKLKVNRLPLKPYSWKSKNDVAELREEFLIPMLDYAAFLAYGKDEPNTLDPASAERRRQAFDSEFPPTSLYSDIRKRRATRNQTRYLDF